MKKRPVRCFTVGCASGLLVPWAGSPGIRLQDGHILIGRDALQTRIRVEGPSIQGVGEEVASKIILPGDALPARSLIFKVTCLHLKIEGGVVIEERSCRLPAMGGEVARQLLLGLEKGGRLIVGNKDGQRFRCENPGNGQPTVREV